MPTVRYTTVQGEIIAEKDGGVHRSYVPDPQVNQARPFG
jgi:hypothetical protein